MKDKSFKNMIEKITSGFDVILRPPLRKFIRKTHKLLEKQNNLKCWSLIRKDLIELRWSSYGEKITRTILKKELSRVLNSRLDWDSSQRKLFLDKVFAKSKSTKPKAVIVQGGAPGLGKGKS